MGNYKEITAQAFTKNVCAVKKLNKFQQDCKENLLDLMLCNH